MEKVKKGWLLFVAGIVAILMCFTIAFNAGFVAFAEDTDAGTTDTTGGDTTDDADDGTTDTTGGDTTDDADDGTTDTTGGDTVSGYSMLDASGAVVTYSNIKNMLDAAEALVDEIIAGTIWDGYEGSEGAMNGDNSWGQSIFIVEAIKTYEAEGGTLTTAFEEKLDSVGYALFLDAYESLTGIVQLAGAIDNETVTDLATLEANFDDFMQTYWFEGSLNSLLSWNWTSGTQFEMFMSERVARVIDVQSYSYGFTEFTNDDDTDYAMYQYVAYVQSFLTSLGYTMNTNGWGVKEATYDVTYVAPDTSDDTADVTPEETPEVTTEGEGDGGCSSSAMATSSILASLALLGFGGVMFTFKKRKSVK